MILRRVLIQALMVLLCVGLLAPILIVVVLSFSGEGYMRFPPESFSLRWYERFLGDHRWRAAMFNSVFIAAMTCVAATAIGFLAAYAMVRGGFKGKGPLTALLLAPLIVPHVVTAIGVYYLSARFGLVGSRPWIATSHAVVAFPVVLVILRAALVNVDPNLERAAMICGCDRWGVFRRVVLPLAWPAVISAALFSFLTSFDELMISLFLAGVRAETLPVRIWHSLLLEVEPTIAAVSTVLIGVTVLALITDWAVRRLRGVSAP
jgi:putative spermidine/putrescine transport system permease protein